MDILMVDFDKYTPDKVQSIVDEWKNLTNNNLLILPKDIGVIRELSVEALIQIRDWINEILEPEPEVGEPANDL